MTFRSILKPLPNVSLSLLVAKDNITVTSLSLLLPGLRGELSPPDTRARPRFYGLLEGSEGLDDRSTEKAAGVSVTICLVSVFGHLSGHLNLCIVFAVFPLIVQTARFTTKYRMRKLSQYKQEKSTGQTIASCSVWGQLRYACLWGGRMFPA